MSEKYNNQDVLDELNLIQPESISYDGTGQISAERTLKNVKGSIARIITSDPDSLFAFMGVLSKQSHTKRVKCGDSDSLCHAFGG